ncbi:C4b-binding protein-like [Rhinoraja longicauda]
MDHCDLLLKTTGARMSLIKLESCGRPADIPDGFVSYESLEKGGLATYSCHPGYVLRGTRSRICNERGWWGPLPECQLVRCDSPEPPANSHVMSGFGFELKYGDMITYRCGVGYDMIGSGVIECSEDNQFHPAPPTCNLIPCARPSSFHNGEITPDRRCYAYGDEVTFRCAP